MSPEVWMGLQADYDLRMAQRAVGAALDTQHDLKSFVVNVRSCLKNQLKAREQLARFTAASAAPQRSLSKKDEKVYRKL